MTVQDSDRPAALTDLLADGGVGVAGVGVGREVLADDRCDARDLDGDRCDRALRVDDEDEDDVRDRAAEERDWEPERRDRDRAWLFAWRRPLLLLRV